MTARLRLGDNSVALRATLAGVDPVAARVSSIGGRTYDNDPGETP